MGRLTGKVAIVTGAASQAEGVGNGAATAILFAREGAKVVLVNRHADRAEALAARIRTEGGEALALAFAAQATAYLRATRAGSTQIVYQKDWADFDAWCRSAGLTALLAAPSCVPPAP